jgi:hypothetical protein
MALPNKAELVDLVFLEKARLDLAEASPIVQKAYGYSPHGTPEVKEAAANRLADGTRRTAEAAADWPDSAPRRFPVKEQNELGRFLPK